ncbi:MAG: heavy-metal-associated domain-containing protein [Gammaproteobacteria bacterium]
MNKLIILPLFLLLWSASLFAAGDQYAVGVNGLACPFCAYGIEKQLSRIQGVDSISTDIKNGTVTITMNEGKTLKQADAARAVDKAGFSMRGFNRKERSE